MDIKLFIFVIILAVVESRPQSTEEFHPEPSIENLSPTTKQLLRTIEEINQKYESKRRSANRANLKEEHPVIIRMVSNQQQFLPLANQVYSYVPSTYGSMYNEPYGYYQQPTNGYYNSFVDNNAEIIPNEEIPGRVVTKKIVHHQSYLLPNYYPDYSEEQSQTVENVRNIVGSYNPYYYNPYNYYPVEQNYARQGTVNIPFQEYFPIIIRNPFQMMFNAFSSMVEYGPAPVGGCRSGTDKVVREPKVLEKERQKENEKTLINAEIEEMQDDEQMNEAVKNEKDGKVVQHARKYIEDNVYLKPIQNSASPVTVAKTETLVEENNSDFRNTVSEDEQTDHLKESESIETPRPGLSSNNEEIISQPERTIKEVTKLSTNFRNLEENDQQETPKGSLFKPATWFNNKFVNPSSDSKTGSTATSPEDPTNANDKSFLGDTNKSISNNVSKDNTGSGVFIHKLKVRKGGVAIAGPGGIATAGSGGTAIVGPNGFAFTHPDSLAIAGSGSKVIAVDPSVNLRDLVSSAKNHTDGRSLRVGKIVATGPVIYYNKG